MTRASPPASGHPAAAAAIKNLFATPLVTIEVPGAAALNAGLLAEIAARRAVEPGVTRSNQAGWHSANDLFERAEPAHRELAAALREAVWAATRLTVPGVKPSLLKLALDGWINVNPRGAYNAPHDHPGAYWSGTYYAAVPDGPAPSGAIEFLDPRTAPTGNGAVRSAAWSGHHRVQPVAGQVLLFPATLRHWVHPHDADEERVTVAFNARFGVAAAEEARPPNRATVSRAAARPRA